MFVHAGEASRRGLGWDRSGVDSRPGPCRSCAQPGYDDVRVAAIALLLLLMTNATAQATEPSTDRTAQAHPSAREIAWAPTPASPLSCVTRVEIPAVDQAMEAVWSPDGKKLAVVRIVTSTSRRTVTGYEEDPRLSLLDLERGTVEDLGEGSRPAWSASGSYLSFWRGGRLHVTRAGVPVTAFDATVPDTRWVGDELLSFFRDEIRGWSDAGYRVISRTAWDQLPRYPLDDASFSADGVLFTITRYGRDGDVARFIGETATGALQPLDAPGATLTEWAPVGRGLLVRSETAVEMIGASRIVAPLSSFPGPMHGWAADGSLLMGAVTDATRTAFDRLQVWREGSVVGVATLPNLVGSRSFSPDGRHFAGVARTGLHETVLAVYRCGTRTPTRSQRADPVARAFAAAPSGDGRPLMRPVAGYISQFFQGLHTGIDIAAPYGATLSADGDGEVTFVGWVPVGGRAVCITHADGLESCYYHTSVSYVTTGQRVVRGEPIAAVGMTGLTTGPHVHWEVKKDGRIVDPLTIRG